MEKIKYYSYDELIDMIDEPNRTAAKAYYSKYQHIIDIAKGSTHKHQAWSGGFKDHIEDICNLAISQWDMMNARRPLMFSKSDAILVLMRHDDEKPFKYAGDSLEKAELAQYSDYKDFILAKSAEFGFVFSEEHLNALKYIHGEGEDYRNDVRIQSPLAAFVHCCDTMSARIWYNEPKTRGEW